MASFSLISDVNSLESGESEIYSQYTSMENEDRNRDNTSISDEDSIPVVITGRQYERRTIENIFDERFGLLLLFIEYS